MSAWVPFALTYGWGVICAYDVHEAGSATWGDLLCGHVQGELGWLSGRIACAFWMLHFLRGEGRVSCPHALAVLRHEVAALKWHVLREGVDDDTGKGIPSGTSFGYIVPSIALRLRTGGNCPSPPYLLLNILAGYPAEASAGPRAWSAVRTPPPCTQGI